MDLYSLCRICLTTDEAQKFKTIKADDEILEKIQKIFNIEVPAGSLLCKFCEIDVTTAWRVFCNINDASDFFRSNGKILVFPDEANDEVKKINFECGTCSKSFDSRQDLDNHIAGHSPTVCFFCKKSFKSDSNYLKHLKSFHNASNKKTIKQLLKKQ